jgi:hypothetical protein
VRDTPLLRSLLPVATLLVAADLLREPWRGRERAAGDATPERAATSMPPR